jgi:hypothetical protein
MLDFRQTLFSRTLQTLRQTPKHMVGLACAMGLLAGAYNVAQAIWPFVPKLVYLIGSCGVFLAWAAVHYCIVMTMIDRRKSISGLIIFLIANILRFMPVFIAITTILVFPKNFNNGSLAGLFLILALIGAVLVMMLPAWPIDQTQSKKFVSPWRALKATKDHRFYLLILAGLANCADRFVPTLSAIHDPVRVALAVAESTAVYSYSNLMTAAIAASAFFFAIKNDPSICG